MTQVETSSPDVNLTAGNTGQESSSGSTEPTEESALLDGAKNYQHALQKSAEKLKEERAAREAVEEKLREVEEAEKQKKLEGLSDTEKWKTIAQEEQEKRGELELKLIVQKAIAGKNLPQPIVELLTTTPWAVPEVYRETKDNFSWDIVTASVSKHLPSYVESLVVEDKPSEEEPLKRVDSERSVETTVFKNHIYTRSEVAEISKDSKEWEKHREAILAQAAKNGGQLPE